MTAMLLALMFAVILLTTPDGHPIWVETRHIQTIRDGRGCPAASNAIIRFDSGSTLCVRETPDEIGQKTK